MADDRELGDRSVTFQIGLKSLQRALPDYDLVRQIGAGSMGIVFEAEDTRLQRRVAIKVLQPSATHAEQRKLRFRREVEAIAKLSHPNIVPIYDVGEAADLDYFVMGYVEGPTLSEVLEKEGRLETNRAFRIVEQVVSALAEAHRHSIVHRDVKPANLILQPNGKVILTDFGLARAEGAETMTETGAIVGTPMYMAPEQIVGDKHQVDGRSDLYGVGATLYHMLTGSMPFEGTSATAVLRSVLEKPPMPFSRSGVHPPRDAQKIVLKLLNKSPDDRYATADSLLQDVSRLQSGLPVEASFPGVVTRFQRMVGRHPVPSAIVAVVVVVAGVALTGQIFQSAKESQRQETKIEELQTERDLAELDKKIGAKIDAIRATWTYQDLMAESVRGLEEFFADENRKLLEPQKNASAGAESKRQQVIARLYPYAAALFFYQGLGTSTREGLDRSLEICDEGLQLDPMLTPLKFQKARVLWAQLQAPEVESLIGDLTDTDRKHPEYPAFRLEINTRFAQVQRFVPQDDPERVKSLSLANTTLNQVLRDTEAEELRGADANPYILRERARALVTLGSRRRLNQAESLIEFVKSRLPGDPHTQALFGEVKRLQRGSSLLQFVAFGEEGLNNLFALFQQEMARKAYKTFRQFIDPSNPEKMPEAAPPANEKGDGKSPQSATGKQPTPPPDGDG